MQINKIPLSVLIISISVFGCRLTVKEYPEYEKMISEFTTSTDTVVIAKAPDGDFMKSYYTLNNWNKKFNPPIECEFELRAWVGVEGLTRTQRAIIIRKKDGIFTGHLLSFDRTVDKRGIKGDSLINVSIKEIKPKSGWGSFSKEFFAADFLSLFDLNKDHGENWIDGDMYYIELISGNHYWLTYFSDPFETDSVSNNVLNAKKAFIILKKEFL